MARSDEKQLSHIKERGGKPHWNNADTVINSVTELLGCWLQSYKELENLIWFIIPHYINSSAAIKNKIKY